MRPQDIISQSDNRSKSRAANQDITAKLYKVENNNILYTVTSSEGNKQYLVTIQLLGLTGNKLKSLKSALQSDIKISCTCPAFSYQGYKYITYKKQSGIDKETRAPNITNPEQKGMACKHIIVALDQMKSDYSKIYDMMKAQIPKQQQTQTSNKDVKNNKDSNEPTEADITALTNFKDACNKVYSNYNDFLNDEENNGSNFINSKYYDKVDPTLILSGLSKPVVKQINNMFIGKLKSINDILKTIDTKKNGFNVMLNSDISTLIKKINSFISSKTEALINDIILNLICS